MKNILDVARDVLDLVKQLVLAGILLCLVFYPAFIGNNLARMGVTEGDFWGMKFKTQLDATDSAFRCNR